MPVLTTTQVSSWDSVYFCLVHGIIGLISMAFLLRSTYKMRGSSRGSRAAEAPATVTDESELGEIILDTLPTAVEPAGTYSSLEANPTPHRQLPHCNHDPQDDVQKSQASSRPYDQHVLAPQPFAAAAAIPEQDAGTRYNATHHEQPGDAEFLDICAKLEEGRGAVIPH